MFSKFCSKVPQFPLIQIFTKYQVISVVGLKACKHQWLYAKSQVLIDWCVILHKLRIFKVC